MSSASSYQLGREIARGGMGAVLDARDQKLGRSVAMKVMLRRSASEEEQQRFLQEARVLGQLAHPNIVPVHDVGTDEQGRLFYTMKLVVGVTLHEVIGKLKAGDKDTLAKYPLNALLTAFQKVCDAVAFAHSRGIIHRDLKPQNIMVGEFGEVLVMDWGLAKILPNSPASDEAAKTLPLRGQLGQTWPTGTLPLNDPAEDVQITIARIPAAAEQGTIAAGSGGAAAPKLTFGSQQPEPAAPSGVYATLEGAVMGTPHFMSPEQAAGKIAELDARSDIFSLGGILYALLTLRPPVEGDSLEEILSKVRSGTIAPPTAFNAPSSTTQAKPSATGPVTEPRKIHPLPHCPDGKVPTALSAVTMKALTRDKARRYQTVAEFTRDIVAYQGGFATSAEDANALTLLRLFIHRHKALTAAASLTVLLTIGFLFKVNAEKRAAEEASARAAVAERLAEGNAQKAIAEAERATKAEAAAVEESEAARQALAKAALNLAEAAMREANGVAMQSALNDVPDDLRDSTWSYLLAQSDRSIARLGAVESIAADPTRPGVFAAADASGKVTIVNARTGERSLEFRLGFPDASGGTHYRIAFSPDGQRIAAGRARGPADANVKGGLVLHRAKDGAKENEWATPPTDHLEFGRNDALLRQGRGSLQVWNPTTGQLWWEEKADGNIGVKGCFTPGGNEIVKFTSKDRLQLVKANDGSLIRALGGRSTGYEWFMAVRPDGKALVTWTETRITECVSLEDGKVLFALPDKKRRPHMGFSRDGAMLLTAALRDDGIQSIEAWNAKTGEPLRSLLGGKGTITQLGLHPLSGELILAGASSRVWDTAGPAARWRIGSVPAGNIAFWGPEDWVFGFVSGRANWGLHRLQPERLERLWQDDRSGSSLAETSADGSLAVIGRPQGTEIALFRKDGTKVGRVNGFSVPLATYRYRPSPNGSRVVLMARAKELGLRVYDTAGKESVKLERANVTRITDIRWLSEQRLLGLLTFQAARGDPGSQESIVVWDAGTGKVLQTVTNLTTMDTLAIEPEGRRFAEAGADKLVRIRDATTLEVQQQFRAHNAPITVLAWHPTQPIIATGSEDLSIKVWNFETGRLLIEYRDLLNPPDQLIFSPTGLYLAARTFPDLVGRIWSWQGEPQAQPGAASPGTPSQSPGAAGWADLLASLTPATVGRAATGWRMDGGVLFSSGQARTVLPLPGDFSNASYQVRVRLRRLVPKDFFSLVLPVGSRKVGFVLDGTPDLGFVTGLNQVDGKSRAASPGAVKGLQVRDSEQRELEVTVRLDGAHATITATLDNQPCYSWTGPVASLSQHPDSVPTPPGALAIKAIQTDWVVYEVKVKRLDGK